MFDFHSGSLLRGQEIGESAFSLQGWHLKIYSIHWPMERALIHTKYAMKLTHSMQIMPAKLTDVATQYERSKILVCHYILRTTLLTLSIPAILFNRFFCWIHWAMIYTLCPFRFYGEIPKLIEVLESHRCLEFKTHIIHHLAILKWDVLYVIYQVLRPYFWRERVGRPSKFMIASNLNQWDVRKITILTDVLTRLTNSLMARCQIDWVN